MPGRPDLELSVPLRTRPVGRFDRGDRVATNARRASATEPAREGFAMTTSLLRVVLLSFLSLGLVLGPARVEAASSAQDAFLASLAASAPRLAKEPKGYTRSTSPAYCWDGSSVTCTGSSTSAVDSNCAGGQQGSCWGSSSGTRYCPACPPTCSAFTYCPNGQLLACSGTQECVKSEGCWVMCDYQWQGCSEQLICGF